MRITPKVVRWTILAAGVVFSLYLESFVRPDVFMSGDGGVKLLLTKQLAAGDLHAELRLPANPWVRDLWDDGLFPLRPPFVWKVDDRRYIGFPIFPSLLSVPGYVALGYRGLYLIPLLALWATWLVVADLCRRLDFGAAITCLVLVGVIFASPLTLYGSMFWEHTLAVALATAGLATILASGEVSRGRVVTAGVLLGLSAWIRSELLCFVTVTAVCFGVGAGRRRPLGTTIVVTLGALILLNLALYGQPFGVQGLQIVSSASLTTRLATAGKVLIRLTRLLVVFFPLVVPTAVLLLAKPAPVIRRLALTLTAFFLLVPAIVPSDGGKQWGPRYLLVMVPMIAVMAGVQLRRLERVTWRAAAVSAVVAAIGRGTWMNAVSGARALAVDYGGRVAPALDVVSRDATRLVAVSNQFIGMELAAAWDEKRFFLTQSGVELTRLAAAAIAHGEDRFLFLAASPMPGAWRWAADGGTLELRMTSVGQHGNYFVHVATIRGVPAP